jgi:hypothetical protein
MPHASLEKVDLRSHAAQLPRSCPLRPSPPPRCKRILVDEATTCATSRFILQHAVENTCNIDAKQLKQFQHSSETLEKLHGSDVTLGINVCNICVKPLQHLVLLLQHSYVTLATYHENTVNIWNARLQHVCKTTATYASSCTLSTFKWNASNISWKHQEHLKNILQHMHHLVLFQLSNETLATYLENIRSTLTILDSGALNTDADGQATSTVVASAAPPPITWEHMSAPSCARRRIFSDDYTTGVPPRPVWPALDPVDTWQVAARRGSLASSKRGAWPTLEQLCEGSTDGARAASWATNDVPCSEGWGSTIGAQAAPR